LLFGQAGDLIGHADKLLGQFLEAFVVGDQGFELGSLLGGHPFRELLALDVALENVVRALRGFGAGAALLEELAAQGAAAEAVDGFYLLEDLLATIFELRKRNTHSHIVSIQIQYDNKKTTANWPVPKSGYFFVSHPGMEKGDTKAASSIQATERI